MIRYKLTKPQNVKQGDRVCGLMVQNIRSHIRQWNKPPAPLTVVHVEKCFSGWIVWAMDGRYPAKPAIRLARYDHQLVAVEVSRDA